MTLIIIFSLHSPYRPQKRKLSSFSLRRQIVTENMSALFKKMFQNDAVFLAGRKKSLGAARRDGISLQHRVTRRRVTGSQSGNLLVAPAPFGLGAP
jgi:hypothetical protein